ncbi:HD-GYP domain-containing protein [Clostridium beijerinckii]|uniref:Phosphohydrolase n=1 Tax=Clostridium beijerinckii TaxID=1520 RepID=A0A1S9N5X5_CLOBE|nr:HD domain-containing phosphohydrolase [Clostridium beijerinckii]OOP72860.1 phosphohydrolase [Clostridium beijerinckii]
MILIIHNAINSVDIRLFNHGQKVAYIMMNLLKVKGEYTDEEIRELCTLGVFHDIGAYKVEEIDKLAEIDINAPFRHAIYGSLFIKYFSPLSKMHEIILTHHFSDKYYKSRNMGIISKEGLLLNFSDYIERIYSIRQETAKELIKNSEKYYTEENVKLFLKADKEYNFVEKLLNGSYEEELYSFFEKKILTREEILASSKMLAYSIDFRSEATVKHTILVEAISYQIGKLIGLDEEALDKIKIASVLHDIGKIAIPVQILEKHEKLTQEEFEIMKKHSLIGYNILSNLNIDDIRDIATLHHEKIDGTGYPFGIKGDELTVESKIVAIGDIASALIGVRSYKKSFEKEKVIKILNDMVKSNKIDAQITKLLINNYDFIVFEALNESNNLMKTYINIKDEYKYLLQLYS